MNNYLIEGVSGTGKTSVCEELQKRGYKTIDADEELAYYGDPETGEILERSPMNWIWHKDKTQKCLQNENNDLIFICGGAMNQNEFAHYFKKTFVLNIDDETLKYRLASRTNNDFGKHPDELALQLKWNAGAVKNANEKDAIIIDATMPIEKVVDQILSHISL
jgi:thymidylate kinase